MALGPQRLDVSFTITWHGAWHVGSGVGTVAVDRGVRRRSVQGFRHAVPYVPGSQIKGVVRHHCQQLAASLGAKVISPHMAGRELPPDTLGSFRPLSQSELLIDRLFGSRFQGDCLYVDDGLPPKEEAPRVHARTQTSIDRLTGGAKEQTLFATEVVEGKESVLHSRIRGRHAPGVLTPDEDGFPFEYALLIAGLLGIESLGGNKSAGLGQCQIEIGNIRWNENRQFLVKDALRSFEDDEWYEYLHLHREETR